MVALFDVNVLVALFDPSHIHHLTVHDWFAESSEQGWVTCPLTENGVIRVLSNPRYPGRRTTVHDAARRLQAFCESRQHSFWEDSLSVLDERSVRTRRIQGHRQLTDVYLLALAVARGGRLVRVDTRLAYDGTMSAVDREQLIDRLTRCVRDRPEILEAYIFGSHARGQAQAHSDLDVAVYVDPARLSKAPFGYQAELTTALATDLGNDAVDVVVLNQAPPLLYHRVLRDGVRVVARDLAATTTREARALSRYCDFVPHLRKIDAAHRHRIERGHVGR